MTRQIYCAYDDEGVYVYQDFSPEIVEYAVLRDYEPLYCACGGCYFLGAGYRFQDFGRRNGFLPKWNNEMLQKIFIAI
jgi:hypothetical protein